MAAPSRSSPSPILTAILAIVVLSMAGCALGGGTLGGRDKCWPEGDVRGASIWRGILQIDLDGHALRTPEGDVITLLPGTLGTRVGADGTGELVVGHVVDGAWVAGDEVVARAGDDVTLFGGMAADETLMVCGVEEVHTRS